MSLSLWPRWRNKIDWLIDYLLNISLYYLDFIFSLEYEFVTVVISTLSHCKEVYYCCHQIRALLLMFYYIILSIRKHPVLDWKIFNKTIMWVQVFNLWGAMYTIIILCSIGITYYSGSSINKTTVKLLKYVRWITV